MQSEKLKLEYVDFEGIKQSTILSDMYITEIIQATSSGPDESLYKFGGHLEFKTTDEALKFYSNCISSPLKTTIGNTKYEFSSSPASRGNKVIILANKI